LAARSTTFVEIRCNFYCSYFWLFCC